MPPPTHRQHEAPLAILLLETGELVHAKLRSTLAGMGLRPRHCQLLTHLADTGSTGQQDLLEALDLDPSVLVGLLNDLEGEGLVERQRDPADRRRHIVKLSGRGGRELGKMNTMLTAIEEAMFAEVSPADQAAVRRALRAMCRGHAEVATG